MKISEPRPLLIYFYFAGIAAAIGVPLALGNQYYLQICANIGINIILALGLNIITGMAGQLSLCQGAFFGVGAYACALLVLRLGLSFWLALPLAAAGTALLGMAISFGAFRLRGHYLAMLTLAFSIIVAQVLTNWVDLTRGPSGLMNIPWPGPIKLGLFELNVADRKHYYIFIILTVAVMMFLANRIRNSRLGMSLMAIRDDEIAAAMIGINTKLCKVIAFGLSGFFGAIAGGVYAHYAKILTPDEFGILQSINILLMLVIGGAGSVAGAGVGAAVVTILPEALRVFADYRMMIFGALLIFVITYFPQGVFGSAHEWIRPFRSAAKKRAQTAAALATLPMIGKRFDGGKSCLLAIEEVSKNFVGLNALTDVSLKLAEGETVGLIGPNGSGKTTLINVISGAYRPSSGRVFFAGKPIVGQTAHAISNAGISRTFQKIRLFRHLTVFDNVAAALEPERTPAWLPALWRGRVFGRVSSPDDAVMQLLATVGLGDRRNDLARNLSYGEQRMLEIARALATRPRLILLDEPAAGLSAIDVEKLREIIAIIQRAAIAVLLIDHHTPFLVSVAERIVVLNQGRIIFDGAPRAARRDQGVVEAYLGAAAHAV